MGLGAVTTFGLGAAVILTVFANIVGIPIPPVHTSLPYVGAFSLTLPLFGKVATGILGFAGAALIAGCAGLAVKHTISKYHAINSKAETDFRKDPFNRMCVGIHQLYLKLEDTPHQQRKDNFACSSGWDPRYSSPSTGMWRQNKLSSILFRRSHHNKPLSPDTIDLLDQEYNLFHEFRQVYNIPKTHKISSYTVNNVKFTDLINETLDNLYNNQPENIESYSTDAARKRIMLRESKKYLYKDKQFLKKVSYSSEHNDSDKKTSYSSILFARTYPSPISCAN